MKTELILLGFVFSTVIPVSLAANIGINIDWPTELNVSCEPATPGRTPGRTDIVVSVAGLEIGRSYYVTLEGHHSGVQYFSPNRSRDPSFLYKKVRPGQYEIRVRENNSNRAVIAAKTIIITAPQFIMLAPETIAQNTPIKISLSNTIGLYQRGSMYLTLVPAYYPLSARGPGSIGISASCKVVQHEFKGLPAGNYELRLLQSYAFDAPLLAKRSIVVGSAVINDVNSQGDGQISQCWLLPNGSSMPATANSTPPIARSILGACGTTSIPFENISLPLQQLPTPSIQRGIVKLSLGTGKNSDNCVFFARDRVPTLPTGLDTWQGKLNAINSVSPQEGSVAMIGFSTGAYRDVGHAAVVESISGNSIAIIEANYTPGQITRRTATGVDLADAARQLGISGYYRP